MFENLGFAMQLAREATSDGKLLHIFRQQVFHNRLATPAVMDLTALDPQQEPLQSTGCQFIELTLEDVLAGKWKFAVPSRYHKALRNFRRGMRDFALVKNAIVLGDVWCVAPTAKGVPVTHPDLYFFGLTCGEGDAYAQDMLIDPAYRGKNLAVPLQRSLHLTLKKEGWQKVYGGYWDDNIPALWMHRMLKYKELPKRRVSRFFFIIHADSVKPTKNIV